MSTADCVESLMIAYGSLPDASAEKRLCEGMLVDLLPPIRWWLCDDILLNDGSIWHVWTW